MQIRMCCYITQLRARLSKEMSPLSKVTHYFRTVAFMIISKTIYLQTDVSTRSRLQEPINLLSILELQSGLFPNYCYTECS